MWISMLLSRAIQVRPRNSAPVYPNLKPHLGLYSVRTRAHPKKSTFVHNLLNKHKYAEILSRYHQKNFDFPKLYWKIQLSCKWSEIVKHVKQLQNRDYILLYKGQFWGHQIFEIDFLSNFYARNHSFLLHRVHNT